MIFTVTMMKSEIKKVVGRVKEAQGRLQMALQDRTWIEEARKYADKQGKDVRKLLAGDVDKVRAFIERERKELERLQKQIPGEVKKLKKFFDQQKKELEKLLKKLAKTRKLNLKSKGKGSQAKKGKSAGSAPRKRKKAAQGPRQGEMASSN